MRPSNSELSQSRRSSLQLSSKAEYEVVQSLKIPTLHSNHSRPTDVSTYVTAAFPKKSLSTKPLQESPFKPPHDSSLTIVNQQITELVHRNQQAFNAIQLFASNDKSIKANLSKAHINKSTFVQNELKKQKHSKQNEVSIDYSKVSKRLACILAAKNGNDCKAFIKAKGNLQIEIEDDRLRIKNALTNQKLQLNLTQLFELFIKYYNSFVIENLTNLEDLTAKFKVVLPESQSISFGNVRQLFWSNSSTIQPRLTFSSVLNFIVKNYNCESINRWIGAQRDRLGNFKSAVLKTVQTPADSSSIISTKDFLPFIKDPKLRGTLFDVKITQKRKQSGRRNGRSVSFAQEPKLMPSLPDVNEFIKTIYLVYERLLNHFFDNKIEKVRTQIDAANLYKENVRRLITEADVFYQFANINERNVITRVNKQFQLSESLVPVDFEVGSLESLLHKHGYNQEDNSLMCRKHWKGSSKLEGIQ